MYFCLPFFDTNGARLPRHNCATLFKWQTRFATLKTYHTTTFRESLYPSSSIASFAPTRPSLFFLSLRFSALPTHTHSNTFLTYYVIFFPQSLRASSALPPFSNTLLPSPPSTSTLLQPFPHPNHCCEPKISLTFHG